MDTCLPEWNTEVEVELPVPSQRKPLGGSDELVELIWQNGEVVLSHQTHRKPTYDTPKSKKVHKPDQPSSRASGNLNNIIQDDETDSWIHCPIDESFEKEFLADLSSKIPSSNPIEARKVSEQSEGVDFFKFSSSDVNRVFPSLEQPNFAPISLPPPRFETFDTAQHRHNLGGTRKTGNLELPVKRQGFSQMANDEICKCSVKNYAQKVDPQSKSTKKETLEQAITSSGGSPTRFWRTEMCSNGTDTRKRKIGDVEETECRSDATELESAAGNKSSSPKCGTTRRCRVAEVHNLSERKRRDRINEKLRALQELIPHSSKSGKASILDDAIQYLKSLQLQLQLMRMRSGMAQMMLPGMQHYLSRLGMGIGQPMLPAIQNLIQSSRLPLVDQAINIAPTPNQATINGQRLVLNPVNYQNQMQNPSFLEQYANYMGFCSMQNTSQLTNMFNIGSHSTQQNRMLAQPSNGNGSMGWTTADNVPSAQ